MAVWDTDWRQDTAIWTYREETPYSSWWRSIIDPDNDGFEERSGGLKKLRDDSFACFEDAVIEMVRGVFSATRQLPPNAQNRSFDPDVFWLPKDAPLRATPPAAGTPIVGVIDDGIALSHRRFQDGAGRTRILAAWQQGTTWGTASGLAGLPDEVTSALPDHDSPQHALPCGAEIYQDDIDALRAAHVTGDTLDEDAFNRAAGLVDMHTLNGPRTLAFREAHGTHVADIAGGNSDAGLMFVNLPSRRSVGLSGTFIENLLVLGVLRIITLADRLWDTATKSAPGGYPIVINMSFSKMAGGRDALTPLGLILSKINDLRALHNKSKVHFVFPTGNDNLLQGVGSLRLKPGKPCVIPVDIPPGDQTSNYIEVWTQSAKESWVKEKPPLAISVSGPGQMAPGGALTQGDEGQFKDLLHNTKTLARLYCSVVPVGSIIKIELPVLSYAALQVQNPLRSNAVSLGGPQRQRYVLAFRPTQTNLPDTPECPAGRWEIALENRGLDDLIVTIAVQSDQSALPAGTTGRRPKLFDPKYETHDDEGRMIDSYDPVTGADRDTPADEDGIVFRHGTINALSAASQTARSFPSATPSATGPYIFVASGYRGSDGRPAPYASTGLRRQAAWPSAKTGFAPNGALPTDDSATLFGILASGARDGSQIAYRGTSFAAAQATRLLAERLAHVGAGFGTNAIAEIEVRLSRPPISTNGVDVSPKIGKGYHGRAGNHLRVTR